jgi:hypothetical protein
MSKSLSVTESQPVTVMASVPTVTQRYRVSGKVTEPARTFASMVEMVPILRVSSLSGLKDGSVQLPEQLVLQGTEQLVLQFSGRGGDVDWASA